MFQEIYLDMYIPTCTFKNTCMMCAYICNSLVLFTQVSGGSGMYMWSVEPEGVVSVSSRGTLTTITRGVTLVIATDKKNTAHHDKSQVFVGGV